jgi:hypothetical protein
VGRSVAQYVVPGRTARDILEAAIAFGMHHGMRPEPSMLGTVVLAKGSKFWTWRRVLRVAAADAGGGATVLFEAWAETLFIPEISADPNQFVGLVPRRNVYRLAAEFLRWIGVPGGESVLQHG